MLAKLFVTISLLLASVYPYDTHLTEMETKQTVARPLPKPDHIVVVVEENHSDFEIYDNPSAPYINSLAKQGVSFPHAYATSRPSQPNYFNLFAGSNLGINSNACPLAFSNDNLGSNLIKAGYTFKGYSDGLPKVGYTGCVYKKYARKHSPWASFKNIPSNLNVPFSQFPKSNFSQLPTVSFITPDLDNDMHDGSISRGDTWLKENLDDYVQWAKKNNSLLILTWDEGSWFSNHIPTIFVGEMVKPGVRPKMPINHFNMLRTIEEMYGLPYLGKSGGSTYPITEVWK